MLKQSSYTHEELLQCGHGKIFGPGNARLPIPPMLMMNRILKITEDTGIYGNGEMVAELDITPDLWFFDCHFPTDPVMPGCLGLDAMWQLIGFFLGWKGLPGRGRALGVKEVKFTGQVLRNAQKVVYQIHMRRIFVRQKFAIGLGDGTLTVDDTPIYSAKDLRVGVYVSIENDF